MDIYEYIDRMVEYGKRCLELDPRNENYVKNTLWHILESEGEVAFENFDENKLSQQARDAVYGTLSLSPAEVNDKFSALLKTDSRKATDWLYGYCVKNDYVKRAVLDRNPRFEFPDLVVTINKAKPEYRDPKKAASGNSVEGGYAKCSICRENEGFYGRAKRTLRTVDITLGGERWFWQYSPYGYFNEHGIAVNCEHTPMHVDGTTFGKLMDFADTFPHYFIGCNAALPRIGGSVLAHDHYQGGGEILPMHRAKAAYTLKHGDFPNAVIETLDWNGTVVRVVSKRRGDIEQISELIRAKWVDYNDEKLGIVSDTADGKHNAVSPTVIKTARGYEMNLILRSNLTDAEHPDGVFNTRPAYHIIKKESIGLIEAQGLFILPGRLDEQLGRIENAVSGGAGLPDDLSEFGIVYDGIKRAFGSCGDVREATKATLYGICRNILTDTAVFKDKKQTVGFLRDLGIK